MASLKFVKPSQKDFRTSFSRLESFLQASLVVAVLVLLYCLYVVQDWLDMLTHDQVGFSPTAINMFSFSTPT